MKMLNTVVIGMIVPVRRHHGGERRSSLSSPTVAPSWTGSGGSAPRPSQVRAASVLVEAAVVAGIGMVLGTAGLDGDGGAVRDRPA